MNQQKKTLPIAVTLAVLVGIALGALGFYFLMKSASSSGVNVNNETYIVATSTMATTSTVASTTSADNVVNATNITAPIATSTWQTYINYELGFSMQYPPDVTADDTSDPGTVTFTFPATYFSTVMKDSDSVSVVVSTTCTPVTSFSDAPANSPDSALAYPQTVVVGGVNGVSFTENIQSDIGAGNHGTRFIYDTNQNNSCYRITSSAQGPNDAGVFGISDPAEIAEVNAAHTASAAYVAAIANVMIQSFTFVNTGAGENEAFYSSSAAGPANGSSDITITTISPTTISIGGQLTLNGAGFSANGNQDTVVWISNGSVNGFMWSGMPQNDSLITATVPTQACTQDINAVGVSGSAGSATCPSYLIINPGTYTLTVSNENGTTDPVYVKVQ
jgi:hypothetical protein